MKRHQYFLIFAWIIILSVSLAACRPNDDMASRAVGKWETIYVQTDGYGTMLDMRVVLDMKRNGQCVQRTYSVLSKKLYDNRNCSYDLKEDDRIWVTYDNGQKLQMDFEGDELVIYNVRPSYGPDPHPKFRRMK